jgi:hypothetical protein
MATDLKDENEKIQGENDLLSKRLEMRDGELLECRRKLRELETLQATAVSEYPAEGLRAVQARPVEGGQSLEAVEAVAVGKMGGFQVTQGWTQIIGASPVGPGHENPKDLALRTDKIDYASKCTEMENRGLIGWRERNYSHAAIHGYGWWPRSDRDPTKMLEETYKDSRINTYISPGIDFRTLVDVSRERGFKLVFEHPDDIHAARFFELDFVERAEQGGGSRKRSKRRRSKRTKRKRSKRRRTKRKRTKRKRTNRRRSRRRF